MTDLCPSATVAECQVPVRGRLAHHLGVGRTAIERAEAVVEAAEQEPEEYGHLVEQMDRSCKVTGAYRRLTVLKQAKELDAAPPVLPTGPFHVIIADPPWWWTKKTVHKHARREHHRQRQLQAQFLINRSGIIVDNDVTKEDDCQGTKLKDVPKLTSLSAN